MPNSYYGYSMPSERGYWTRRKWFTLMVFIFLFWCVVYLFTHIPNEFAGYKYTKFSTEQVTQITKILVNNEVNVPSAQTLNDTAINKDSSAIPHDSVAASMQATTIAPAKIKCDSCGVNNAMIYLRGEFGDRIEERQLYAIREYMSRFGPFETGNYLAGYKLKTRNFFWLVGPSLYLETIFWTIIGVLCSIIFTIGQDMKNYPGKRNSKYYVSQIPYDIAKFFYAPFFTIVILLCYNYIKHRNIIEVNTSEGMIVFAFITGLFSGRLMGSLQRIKDAIVPEYRYSYKSYGTVKGYESKYSSLKEAKQPEPISTIGNTLKEKTANAEIPFAETYSGNTEEDIYQITENIKEIIVDLKLDARSLFEDEKTEIQNGGFKDAAVTLHNVNGKDIMHFKRLHDANMFSLANIKPGIYILRATLTQQLSDRYLMNLFGEKTVFLTHENSKVELYIKKYEALD